VYSRPYYRPYYRPVYRPIYRSPRTYVHFGPVFGVRINTLPYGYSRIYVGSNPYYYNQGVYYRPYSNSNMNSGYEVVAPPLGAMVDRLPANATVTMIDGRKYYQLGGTFYQEELDENSRVAYRVVGTDGVINTVEEEDPAYLSEAPVPAPAPAPAPQDDNLNAYDEVVPSVGSRFDVLPLDSKVQVINQQKYFISPKGVYYIEVIEGDRIRYEVTNVQ
jgi:hypothetical protein